MHLCEKAAICWLACADMHAVMLGVQRPLNTRDPVSLAGRDTNYRNTPISWKGPKHEKCIVDKVMVTSEWLVIKRFH
jgi:hypothetical protein